MRKAAYRRLAERAVAGDAKALDYLLSLESEEHPPGPDQAETEGSAAKDLVILQDFSIVGALAYRNTSMMSSSADPAEEKGEQMKSPQRASHLPTGLTIKRARDEACRQDFVSFIRMSFDLLMHGEPLLMNWHIEAMAYHLEQVQLGRIKRLIINLPPRYLKSLVTSVAFPAFLLATTRRNA